MTTAKRVTAFVGSPRVGGNTDVLVDEVLRGARAAGAETEKVHLGRLEIGPCLACDACLTTGRCVQSDDMGALLEEMERSDVWVLGTPVYWWGATAQFKVFLDRWYAPWHGAETKRVFEDKRIVLVVAMGDTDRTTADPVLAMFERSLAFLGLDRVATVLGVGVDARGEAAERSELINEAQAAGHLSVA